MNLTRKIAPNGRRLGVSYRFAWKVPADGGVSRADGSSCSSTHRNVMELEAGCVTRLAWTSRERLSVIDAPSGSYCREDFCIQSEFVL